MGRDFSSVRWTAWRYQKNGTGYTLRGVVDSRKARRLVMWVRRPPGPESDARWHHVALVTGSEVTTACSAIIRAPVDFRVEPPERDDIECPDCLEIVRAAD